MNLVVHSETRFVLEVRLSASSSMTHFRTSVLFALDFLDFSEFADFLEHITRYSNVVIIGDINIHLDRPDDQSSYCQFLFNPVNV